MQIISTRMLVPHVDEHYVALVLGTPIAEFGEEVILDAVDVGGFLPLRSLYVGAVDTTRIGDLSADVLKLWDLATPMGLVAMLERLYRTGLSEHSQVTMYSLYDQKFWDLDEVED